MGGETFVDDVWRGCCLPCGVLLILDGVLFFFGLVGRCIYFLFAVLLLLLIVIMGWGVWAVVRGGEVAICDSDHGH